MTVWLLREAAPGDLYVAALENRGYSVRAVPVLSFRTVEGSALQEAWEQRSRFAALVLTSPRSAEIIQNLLDERGLELDLPVYAVGDATASKLIVPASEIRGTEAGDAVALADRIIEDGVRGRVLFPCGNRARDTLPRLLRAAGVEVGEVVVYETNLREAPELHAIRPGDVVVFFSPSGVEAASPYLTTGAAEVALVAIGETTAAALRNTWGRCDAAARVPTPEGVVQAIASLP